MKTENLPEPEVNKDCKYKETNCLVKLPCLFCAYDEMIAAGNLEYADETFTFFKKLFDSKGIERVAFEKKEETTSFDKPTDKQVSYLTSLAEKQMGSSAKDFVDEKVAAGKTAVSNAISELLSFQKKSEQTIKPGTYKKKDGTLVKVVLSKSTGKPYGKILNQENGKWEYQPGALNGLF